MNAPTAPKCIVVSCDNLSSLSVRAEGKFWAFITSYCADCYQALLDGQHPPIDPARIQIQPKTQAKLLS